jgi:hypothetical protein
MKQYSVTSIDNKCICGSYMSGLSNFSGYTQARSFARRLVKQDEAREAIITDNYTEENDVIYRLSSTGVEEENIDIPFWEWRRMADCAPSAVSPAEERA